MKRALILSGIWLAAAAPLCLAGCGKSDSVQEVGYRPLSLGNHAKTGNVTVTPPSSGTTNGTGRAVPPPANGAGHDS